MQHILSCPSKTFLLGEYLILNRGSALLINTEPRFSLSATTAGQGLQENIQADSPAGRFLQQHAEDFATINLQFHDPHHGQGGFGASTAQFLLCYALQQQLNQQKLTLDSTKQIDDLLTIYRQYAWQGHGLAPSGADLLAQFSGQLTLYNNPSSLTCLTWPFPHLTLCLIRTGKKLATHEHLSKLSHLDTTRLAMAMDIALTAIETRDSQQFVDAVQHYSHGLQQLGLLAEHSQCLIEQLPSALALAAKGCGSMGADVIAVLVDSKNLAEFSHWAAKQSLTIIASQNQISAGIHYTHCV